MDPVLPENIDTLLPPKSVPLAAKAELSCNLSGVWNFDLAAVAAFFSVSCKGGGSAKSFSSLEGFLSQSLFLVLPGMIMKPLTTEYYIGIQLEKRVLTTQVNSNFIPKPIA